MRISQVVFLVALLAFAFYATRVRSTVLDRVVYLVLVGSGIALLLNPDWSTRLANLVGIGRGTDLVIYIFIVLSLFYFAGNGSRMRKLERDLTAMVRTIAVHNATAGGSLAPDAREGDGSATTGGTRPAGRGAWQERAALEDSAAAPPVGRPSAQP